MAQDIRLSFGVYLAELQAGLETASAAITEFAAEAKEAIAGAKEALTALNEAFVAVAAVMAGGHVFGEVVSSMVKLNVSSKELGQQLGISATEASVLKVALDETHVTQEQFSAAAQRVLRTLNTNEQAFHELGVATRDAQGNFRPLADIVLDVNTRLLALKEGTDRGVEAQKIYGRSWPEVAAALRLTRAAMEEARKTAQELGLAVSEQSETLTGKYRDAMTSVEETLTGIENVIAAQVLPILTSFGEWFRAQAPAAISTTRAAFSAFIDIEKIVGQTARELGSFFGQFFSILTGGMPATEFFINVLKVLEGGIIGVRTAVELAIEYFQKWFDYTVDLFSSWAKLAERAFHLDWAGVKAAWAEGNKQIEKDWQIRWSPPSGTWRRNASFSISSARRSLRT